MTEGYTSLDVSEYDSEYAALPDPDAELPAGAYQAEVVGSRTVRASDQQQWVLDLRDRGGKGKVTLWMSFDRGEKSREFIKKNAVLMGYRGETFTGIVQAVENGSFDGAIVDITVKISPGETRDFTDVYINRCYAGPLIEGDGFVPEADAAATDDDIPF
jgi:hypothetical protein